MAIEGESEKTRRDGDTYNKVSPPFCRHNINRGDVEWVSHFVDDSFSSGSSLTYPTGKFPKTKWEPETETFVIVSRKPSLTTPVLRKERSKQTRTGESLGSTLLTGQETEEKPSNNNDASTGQQQPRHCSCCLGINLIDLNNPAPIDEEEH
ncbi:hypothetical protein L2E82_00279 [Cichorium intybus]|uniref:Uncharacterized protein n=1 Tax=Cichorium intybus TaxID=13427 RepID=A0ACB9GW72_CICIN|nr:hypothetical protein L2E82_00279 [Cichorium intybus]